MIFTGLLSGVVRLCGDDEEEDSCKGGPAPSSDADVGAVVPMLSLMGSIQSNHSSDTVLEDISKAHDKGKISNMSITFLLLFDADGGTGMGAERNTPGCALTTVRS